MTDTQITYRDGFKYQLYTNYVVDIPIVPINSVMSKSSLIELTSNGVLTIRAGYAWDGPSGISIDTPNFMRGSLVHDALYELMREEKLNYKSHRKPADELLRQICKADGMSSIRAWWVYSAVRTFGDTSADPKYMRQAKTAP